MIYLISDLHLEEKRPDITEAFFFFLQHIEDHATSLYILGDFFEAWVGDDEKTPLQTQIKQRLKEFTSRGIDTYFMAGNRDFLIGETFSNDTGVHILEDPTVVELGDEKVLLMHGDSLCTMDTAYMRMRAMIRAPGFIDTFLARPLEDRLTTARQLREMSQASNKGKTMEIMDVTPEEVINVMQQHNVTTLLHGHTHRPAIHSLDLNGEAGKRIVLGDWDKQIWYAKVGDSGIELQHMPFPNSTDSPSQA